MGRPEPSVLFAQTFTHPHLDEYVDEVLFTEPIVITACEFVEHNASCSSPMVTLLGATSPPSFATEIFVQCEGEPRFRRLCQPFLYSHSSSNVLEVEAVVTNHIVIRGSYRSLTLVVYGNTAEDLGQFNIDYDLDNSLASLVCSPVDGKLEDLPPALRISKPAFEESITSLQSLLFQEQESDASFQMQNLLWLTLHLLKIIPHEDCLHEMIGVVVSTVSSFMSLGFSGTVFPHNHDRHSKSVDVDKIIENLITEARTQLLELYQTFRPASTEVEEFVDLDSVAAEPISHKLLFESMDQILSPEKMMVGSGFSLLSENEVTILRLSVVTILCSSKEGCIQFINGAGMNYLSCLFLDDTPRSTGTSLMLLGVIECITRHAIGCEAFLGWWPRPDVNVPAGTSDGYCYILKLLLHKQRHDIASLAMYILRRLRLYEIAAKFESAVLVSLESSSGIPEGLVERIDVLSLVNSEIKKLMKLIIGCGPVEDPSPAAYTNMSSTIGQEAGTLSYKDTVKLIESSQHYSDSREIDSYLLSLLKDRGFLALSAALLSSPVLRSGCGQSMDLFSDIAGSIENIVLSLLSGRSGLMFLLGQPEETAMLILSLRGDDSIDKVESMPLTFATALISKGFFCHPTDIGIIAEVHLRVLSAIDHLISANPNSEECLWSLWELCALARSDVGRQAMLGLRHFPEAISVLMEALHCVKGEQILVTGTSPLSLAIFHSAAELFEIMVMDTTASSLSSWIGHAVELHKALHSSSPGTSRKDAPTRLLEWIDAGAVYHKKGALGLLRYAAVLASGGDAHLTSSSVLVSDSMDVENVVGDSASGSEIQVVDSLLGKLVSDKYYDGVAFRDSSISQLTTALRILAFIAENSAVAVSLYEEGAVTVLYVVLINCRFMLEQSSSTYDYLVDEGVECNSTSDLLMERSREQSVIHLLIPSLMLLILLLQKLQEAGEQHRNTKLLNGLLRLHREVSPKLAACSDDFSSVYSGSALDLGTVCNLVVSAVACWPVYGWTPSLFQCLLESGPSNVSIALGPKEACGLLCLLGDLFPDEGIWLWKNGRPSLSVIRTLCVGTSIGLHRERDINWYMQPPHFEKLLSRLSPLLDKIAQISLHFTFSALVVVKDLLRVLIVRIACQKLEYASVLVRPILSWLDDHVSESISLSDMDVFKVQRLLFFLASLLEHPCGKMLLLNEGIVGFLGKATGQIADAFTADDKLITESKFPAKSLLRFTTWCWPVFKSFELICDDGTPLSTAKMHEKCINCCATVRDCCSICHYVLQFCQVLPVGKELEACLASFKALACCDQGKSAFLSMFEQFQSLVLSDKEMEKGNSRDSDSGFYDQCNWMKSSPLLVCCRKLLDFIESEIECSLKVFESFNLLCVGCLHLSSGCESLQGVSIIKCLFGLSYDLENAGTHDEEKLKEIRRILALIDSRMIKNEFLNPANTKIYLDQVKSNVTSMLLVLETVGLPQIQDLLRKDLVSDDIKLALWGTEEGDANYLLGGLEDKFMWECPDSSPDRSSYPLPQKRKITSLDGSNRRPRGDNAAESAASSTFRLGAGTSSSSGISRRDTFRQRKPNTSRPPSMHVDDYVARERSMDGLSGSLNNVNPMQRAGSTSGRPPSIHVDEFMARQRERQNPAPPAVTEVAQVRSPLNDNVRDSEKTNLPQRLKPDLDDDHEINIVFDEELESDDVLSFPQQDDSLQTAVIIKRSSDSFNGEIEPGANERNQFSHMGKSDGSENTDISLRRLVPRPEASKVQDTNVSSDKKQVKKLTNPFMVSGGYASQMSTNLAVPPVIFYDKGVSSGQSLGEPRMGTSVSARDSPHPSGIPNAVVSQGFYEQRTSINQPPLPPVPPPPTVSTVLIPAHVEPLGSHAPPFHPTVQDVRPPLPAGLPFATFEASGSSSKVIASSREDKPSHNPGGPLLLAPSSSAIVQDSQIPHSLLDPKNVWASVPSSSRLHDDIGTSSSGPGRPLPPLPPTPHPFSTSIAQASTKSASQPSVYSQTSAGAPPSAPTPLTDARVPSGASQSSTLSSHSTSQFIPPLPPGRPTSIQVSQFSGISLQQGQHLPSHSFPLQIPQIQTVPPRPPLQPPQPPQPPRPIHHPHLLRPMIQVSQQPLEGISLQQSPSTIQIPIQSLPMQQQLQMSQVHVYSQNTQQELHLQSQQQVEHVHAQHPPSQVDNMPQFQQDAGISLQQYFSSPEAIQSLLRDQEKLCQLLEKHPKLMQMLQERLSQL
ncbi:protein virilizer homolog isoform X2 [Nymphaea colorata]|uniref:protein virilizer homolog isoform X2 n=1 Tax=Nymphaea colorata TaxID=210225 RepID=UPI00129DF224|nr:protein virilizer homolog isoform X2 [Nymphaea colorata]